MTSLVVVVDQGQSVLTHQEALRVLVAREQPQILTTSQRLDVVAVEEGATAVQPVQHQTAEVQVLTAAQQQLPGLSIPAVVPVEGDSAAAMVVPVALA